MNEMTMHRDTIPTDRPIDPPGVPEGLTGTVQVSSDRIKAGDTVTVTWRAAAPSSGYRFQLNGSEVPRVGSHTYRPLADTTYRLTATIAQSRISLANHAVAVDSSACTLQGRTLDGPLMQLLVGGQLYTNFSKDAGVRFSNGPFNVSAWLNAASDVGVALENAAELVRVTIPMHMSIDGLPGEPVATITAWFAPLLSGGTVYGMLAKTNVDLSIPPEFILAALLLGPEAQLAFALLRSVAPSVLDAQVRGPLAAIAQIFGLLGDRVVSVRFETDTDSNPFLNTTVCP